MKTVIVLTVISASVLAAEPPPPDKPSDVSSPGNGRAELGAGGRARVVPVPADRKFSGVLVDAKRAGSPLKLFDPRVPADPSANVSRDPVTGRAQGIKLFEIKF